MGRFDADEAGDRLALAVDAVTTHRARGSEGAVFEAIDDERERRVRAEYADRLFTLTVSADERDALSEHLGSFPVFKIKQPETRKAPEGTVHVSAIADAKHAADFLEGAFRTVYGLPADYELRVVRV
ncbi:MAG: hypothetical protein V5A62_01055 [Haloarculaceae archaeon]